MANKINSISKPTGTTVKTNGKKTAFNKGAHTVDTRNGKKDLVTHTPKKDSPAVTFRGDRGDKLKFSGITSNPQWSYDKKEGLFGSNIGGQQVFANPEILGRKVK